MSPDESLRDNNFWTLWESNKKLFFGKCIRMMNGDISEAEDMLSIAMLKAQEKIVHCNVNNFKGWALRLTENVCIDRLRKERRLIHDERHLFSAAPDPIGNDHIIVESIENYWSREDLLQKILDSICGLPRRLREPALLRFLFSESYQEISACLHITEVNARKRIQEARELLKNIYGGDPYLFSSVTEDMRTDMGSRLMERARKEVSAILKTAGPELRLCYKTAWIVDTLPISGIHREVLVFLPFKPVWREKGFASFLRYISNHPGGIKRLMDLGMILYAIGLWAQAESIFRWIIKKRPGSFLTRIFLGDMLMKSEKRSEAEAVFREASFLVHQDSSRHFLSGMAAMSRNNTMKAILYFEKAADLEPSNLSFLHSKGICLFNAGRYKDAYAFFLGLLKGTAEDLVPLTYCCESLILLNKRKKALKYADLILMNNRYDHFALKRKSVLTGTASRMKRSETRRMNLFTERLNEIYRIMEGYKNRKFTDGGLQPSLYCNLEERR